MIQLKVSSNGAIYPNRGINVGMKYDNTNEQILFVLPEALETYNKYVVYSNSKGTFLAPLSDNTWTIRSNITNYPGTVKCLFLLSETELDPNNFEINNVATFLKVSGEFQINVANHFLKPESVQPEEESPEIQLLFNNMMTLYNFFEEAKENDYYRGPQGPQGPSIIAVHITWESLKNLRDNSLLKPGQQYRITDYTTTTAQADTQSAGHQFDIIVTADSADKLNENARAVDRSVPILKGITASIATMFGEAGDVLKRAFSADNNGYPPAGFIYAWGTNADISDGDTTNFIYTQSDNPSAGDDLWREGDYGVVVSRIEEVYFANSKLEAWKLKYCLDNDITRFVWADSVNGKGVIYQMIDEFNNDCPYDFKNIQFKHTDDLYYYTFSAYDDADTGDIVDVSTIQNRFKNDENGYSAVSGNIIKSWLAGPLNEGTGGYSYTAIKLNEIMFIHKTGYDLFYGIKGNIFGLNCYSNNFGNDCNYNNFGTNCYDNTFGNNCYSNTFGNDCYYNTFGDGCISNTFINNCHSNTFDSSCYSNTFGNSCYSNTFGDECYSNNFGPNCNNNTFGNYCYSNTFGNSCSSNTFGSQCYSNTFGNDCFDNTFGNGCSHNTFSDNCSDNTFSDSCSDNTLGNECNNNTFINNCHSNTFGSTCYSNTFGANCYSNTFGDSCSNNTFETSCSDNTFGNEYSDNIFGNNCYSNSFGTSCYSNTFGNYFSNNTFGTNCTSNTFGTNCTSNTFENDCSNNTFENNCYGNTFGNSCTYNTFGTSFSNNTFGNDCGSNTFGNNCSGNTFGNNCSGNTFGTGCTYNTFGNDCGSNTFANSCRSNTFGPGGYSNTFGNNCFYNTFGDYCVYLQISDNTGTAKKYISVENGTRGASSANKFDLYDSAILNTNYQVTFKKDADGRYVMTWLDDYEELEGKYKDNNLDTVWKELPHDIDGGTF